MATTLKFTLFTQTAMRVPSRMLSSITIKFGTRFNNFAFRTLFMSITSIISTMSFYMFGLIRKENKIREHIIARVSIFMMNYFAFLKRSTEIFFHNMTMFKFTFPVYAKNTISILSSTTAFISRMIFSAKSQITTRTRAILLFASGRLKNFSTTFAFMNHIINNIINGLNMQIVYTSWPR